MRPLRNLLPILLLAGIARGDIAPTSFTGTNVFPLQNTQVRMTGADVRIIWGQPCDLVATFSLINDSDQAVELEVGFPVGAYHPDPRGDIFEIKDMEQDKPLLERVGPEVIQIAINGAAIPAFRRLPQERIPEIRWRYASWYFAKISFRPGPSVVSVRTRLNPSAGKSPYLVQLSYCISTGSRWQGPIGWESVEITFPGQSAAALLAGEVPKGGKVSGESVRWEFTEFEPQGNEYDIDFEFYPPPVAAKLTELRTAHAANPADPKAALRYATHLFCLGAAKGNSGFPPNKWSAKEFVGLLERIANPQDRALFTRFYQKDGDGYAANSSEWTEDRLKLIQILANAGYCGNYSGLEHVLEAQRLVEECLKRNPRDAEAWNIYLMHFWRFSFAARGHWFGPTVFSQPLRTAIESAYKNCPKDPTIRAWQKAMKHGGEAPTLDPDKLHQPAPAFLNDFYPRKEPSQP